MRVVGVLIVFVFKVPSGGAATNGLAVAEVDDFKSALVEFWSRSWGWSCSYDGSREGSNGRKESGELHRQKSDRGFLSE